MSIYEREGHKFEYRPYGIRLLNKPKLEVGEIEKIEVADPLECPMFKTKEEAIAFEKENGLKEDEYEIAFWYV